MLDNPPRTDNFEAILREVISRINSASSTFIPPIQATDSSDTTAGTMQVPVTSTELPVYDFAAMGNGADLGLSAGFNEADDLWSLLMGDQVAPPAAAEIWNVKDE